MISFSILSIYFYDSTLVKSYVSVFSFRSFSLLHPPFFISTRCYFSFYIASFVLYHLNSAPDLSFFYFSLFFFPISLLLFCPLFFFLFLYSIDYFSLVLVSL